MKPQHINAITELNLYLLVHNRFQHSEHTWPCLVVDVKTVENYLQQWMVCRMNFVNVLLSSLKLSESNNIIFILWIDSSRIVWYWPLPTECMEHKDSK